MLSQRGVVAGLGMKHGTGGGGGADRLTGFLGGNGISAFVNNDLVARIASPIKFRSPGGVAFGYPATILADICDVVLTARANGALQKQQEHIAAQAEILVRGFARVGIIALVDEATGYQADRAKGGFQGGSNLDRKDSTRGYEVDNVVPCCRRCNYGKNNFFSYEEWVQIGALIRSWSPTPALALLQTELEQAAKEQV